MLLVAALIAIAAAAIVILTKDPGQPAEASGASMSLRVFADKDKSQLVCDTGSVHRKCAVAAGTAFSIDIVADSPPAGGYTAYQVTLQYTSKLTLQQQTGVSENRWPDCYPSSATEYKDVPGSYRITCGVTPGSGNSVFTGALVNVQFLCDPLGGSAQIDLVGGAGANASRYVRPGIPSTVFLKSQTKGGKEVADSVLINCDPDFDDDGCTNDRELGPKSSAPQGGGRDPFNPWDFFDTNGDRYIDLPNDILGVIVRYSAGGGIYDANYDRGPSTGPNPWNMTAPDGTIDLPNDILGVVYQYQHDCR